MEIIKKIPDYIENKIQIYQSSNFDKTNMASK